MKIKRKLLLSIWSLCIVADVIIIGVFAFATQTFYITNKVTFVANNVSAIVTISGTNNGNAIDFDSTQSGVQSSKEFDYTGNESVDSQTFYQLPNQDFTQITKKDANNNDYLAIADIVFTVVIQNRSATNGLKVTTGFSSLEGNIEISRSVSYALSYDGSDYENESYLDGIIIDAGYYLKITITYSKESVVNDESFEDSWNISMNGNYQSNN